MLVFKMLSIVILCHWAAQFILIMIIRVRKAKHCNAGSLGSMPSVIMLFVIVPTVIMLFVIVPSVIMHRHYV